METLIKRNGKRLLIVGTILATAILVSQAHAAVRPAKKVIVVTFTEQESRIHTVPRLSGEQIAQGGQLVAMARQVTRVGNVMNEDIPEPE